MQTVKFRGKRVDKNVIVFGDLIHGVGAKYGKMFILPITYIYPSDCHSLDGYEVIPETVGQFTGLQDKNGADIYEGQKIFNDDRKEIGIVEYDNEKAMFITNYIESNEKYPLWETLSNLYYSVGNIHEGGNNVS